MHGVDDFGVVDAAQVRGGDPDVGMAELPLDDHQRDSLAAHLDRMGVTELVWRDPASGGECRERREDDLAVADLHVDVKHCRGHLGLALT